ncbi:MAG: selenite/tellurite reduction operon rhodanese-like protein ExtH [Trichloromonadaceae bacterium]
MTAPLLALSFAALVLGGCGGGSSSYDEPTVVRSSSVLMEADSVKSLIDQGLLNADGSFNEKVVILDFGSYSMDPAKDALRISGACRVPQADLQAKRFEGVTDASPMVATGEQMDALLQRLGINANTTIIFTYSHNPYFQSRAYWTFRYWGFPKERLKMLNGGNDAFAAAYPELMTREVPVPVASTYSVRELAGLNPDLRASVGEMIGIVSTLATSTSDVVIDGRGTTNYNGQGATPGLVGGDFVVVDGHPVGGKALSYTSLYSDYDSVSKKFLEGGKLKSEADLKALFEAQGWTPGKKVTVYCTSGYSATPLFYALDAVLGADVQLYDGSWSQLGKYSDYSIASGQLPASSAWAIDRYLDPATARYNYRFLGTTSAGYVIEVLKVDAATEAVAPFTGNDTASAADVNQLANQIEVADAAYVGSAAPAVTFSAIATTPLTGQTQNVLINAATLQTWIDAGQLNAPLGSANRVVVLDVTDTISYQKGHIPGAVLWDISKHVETRTEGPAPAVNMVVTGARMDELIQAAGIDENTTIVITSSQTETFFPSRAYFLFRYYGFPKANLKVLNGYNAAWSPTKLVSASTVVTPSTLSVKQVANFQPDTRVALVELLDAVRDGRGVPVDFRGVTTAAGKTAGVFPEVAGDYVVFEGQLNGGRGYGWKGFNVNYDGKDITGDGIADPRDLSFKSTAAITTALNGIGLDGSQLVYSYCRTGYIASTGFFVLDGILGWPVMTYDGSWSQFGQLSADASKGGLLPTGSLWAADNATYMAVTTYNKTATRAQVIEPLNADAAALLLKPSDAAANQIESADKTYQLVPPTSTGGSVKPPTSTGGSAGGGC